MEDKISYTSRVFDSYEKRFCKARENKVLRNPSDIKDKEEIKSDAKKMLRLDKIPTPKIEIINSSDEIIDGITLRTVQFSSWDSCYGEATLFLPSEDKPLPTVMVCPGHAKEGRFAASYQTLAFALAKSGAAVLLADNLGQGSREKFGHPEAFAPHALGLSLQGIMVRESHAWINWFSEQPFCDKKRIGVCGNSGGGTLTLFISATTPQISAAACCGYSSDFSYIHQKEKKHCPCNLLPSCASSADLWEILSTFAPKPLLLNGGKYDQMFPADLFSRNARKIRAVYKSLGAENAFRMAMTEAKHSLEACDCEAIVNFFAENFGLSKYDSSNFTPQKRGCRFEYPESAITTNQLAEKISGKTYTGTALYEVFIPTVDSVPVDSNLLDEELFTVNPMQILAQMEMALL